MVAGVRAARGRTDRLIAAAAVVAVAAGLWAVIAQPWNGADGWPDAEHGAWLPVWVAGPPQPTPDIGEGFPEPVTEDAWAAIVADLRATDPDAYVSMTVPVVLADDAGGLTMLEAVDGTLADGALVAGREPGPGEVVLGAATAEAHGWALGDAIALAGSHGRTPPFATLTLVGLAPDHLEGWVAWADARTLVGTYSFARFDSSGPALDGSGVVADTHLLWNGGIPASLEDQVLPDA